MEGRRGEGENGGQREGNRELECVGMTKLRGKGKVGRIERGNGGERETKVRKEVIHGREECKVVVVWGKEGKERLQECEGRTKGIR